MSDTTTQLKGETMTREAIKAVLVSEDVACSVKGIAKHMKIDAPSEVLREIKDQCWEMVEAGELTCTTVKDTEEQFFSVA